MGGASSACHPSRSMFVLLFSPQYRAKFMSCYIAIVSTTCRRHHLRFFTSFFSYRTRLFVIPLASRSYRFRRDTASTSESRQAMLILCDLCCIYQRVIFHLYSARGTVLDASFNSLFGKMFIPIFPEHSMLLNVVKTIIR